MGSQLTKEEQFDTTHRSVVVAKDGDLLNTDDDDEYEVLETIHSQHPTAAPPLTTKPSNQEEEHHFVNDDDDTHTAVAKKNAKETDDESSDGCNNHEGLEGEDDVVGLSDKGDDDEMSSHNGLDHQVGLKDGDDGVKEDSMPKPGDDTDPRNPEFWRIQCLPAGKGWYYYHTLLEAAQCEEALDMWCGQFAPLTFDMTQDYDTIIKTRDLVAFAIREEWSLSMTNVEYWMKVPTRKFRYVAACRYDSRNHVNKYEWMGQIPGCPHDSNHRRLVHDAIMFAARRRKDKVPFEYGYDT